MRPTVRKMAFCTSPFPLIVHRSDHRRSGDALCGTQEPPYLTFPRKSFANDQEKVRQREKEKDWVKYRWTLTEESTLVVHSARAAGLEKVHFCFGNIHEHFLDFLLMAKTVCHKEVVSGCYFIPTDTRKRWSCCLCPECPLESTFKVPAFNLDLSVIQTPTLRS